MLETGIMQLCGIKKHKAILDMKLNINNFTVEAAAGGGFCAYLMNNLLCSAYGETPDEACENLQQIVDDLVSDVYTLED